jgi:hypothetical protein
MVTQLNISFEKKDFKKLENMKEEAKINGECDNWEDFILKLSGIRKRK